MTVLTRWDPYRELNTLQDRMNRLFRDSVAGDTQDQTLATSAFAPPVDVYEDEHNITLKIEVPGIDEKDIDVRIENNTLTVHGERKFERKRKKRISVAWSGSMEASPGPSLCRRPWMRKRSRPTTTRGSSRSLWRRRRKPSPSRSKSTLAARRLWKPRLPAKPRKLA
jgi:hypothetical protein